MVHELHKAGYQRLRICVGHSLDGNDWRCHLLPAVNMHKDGWTPTSTDKAHLYTSREANCYFGWSDAVDDSARSLAKKFVERFPETARDAIGQDWLYAGWFTSALGSAENGFLPAFYGGRSYELKTPEIPLPPAILDLTCENYVGTGWPNIIHEELTLGDLPPKNSSYEMLWPFCLSFDAYRTTLLLGVDCEIVADQTEHLGLANATMECLRITAFARQRAIKWGDIWPPDERLVNSIRAVVEEIRLRLSHV